jgi:hypothetical protein
MKFLDKYQKYKTGNNFKNYLNSLNSDNINKDLFSYKQTFEKLYITNEIIIKNYNSVENIKAITYYTFNGNFSVPFTINKYKSYYHILFEYPIEFDSLEIHCSDPINKLNISIINPINKKCKLLVVGIFKKISNTQQINFIDLVSRLDNYVDNMKCVLITNDSIEKDYRYLKDCNKIEIINLKLNTKDKRSVSKDKTFKPIYNNKMYQYTTYQYLSFLRNLYIKEIKKDKYREYQYVLVIDPDLNSKISCIGILDSIDLLTIENYGVSANGLGKNNMYYDKFALRITTENVKNLEYSSKKFPNIFNYWNYLNKTNNIKQISHPIKTISSFGGICIYNLNYIKKNNIKYDVETEDCEHIGFNRHFDQIILNPKMLYLYGTNIIDQNMLISQYNSK